MRILGMLRADEDSEAGAPPSKELIERMGSFVEEITKAGVMLATDGLQPTARGKQVRLADSKFTVIDGPFTKFQGADRLICSVPGAVDGRGRAMDQALPRSPGQGECELRPIFEASDFSPEVFSREQATREDATRGQMKRNAGRQ